MAETGPPALRVQGAGKTYEDGFTVVAGLDLEIPSGTFFGLLGPNGAGKTTLIGSVCSIVRPTTGTLTVFGHDHRTREARRLLGLAEREINVDRFLPIRGKGNRVGCRRMPRPWPVPPPAVLLHPSHDEDPPCLLPTPPGTATKPTTTA
ncbi:ATP-binding cassette domain-containing protein [Streptomyces sp. NPDC051105]|uniref:ATP-binding cassette domain-containing protein n=1 Tax=Streptomyces sp. NPDC051105 TaxID=3154843 RepID=UPI0034176653